MIASAAHGHSCSRLRCSLQCEIGSAQKKLFLSRRLTSANANRPSLREGHMPQKHALTLSQFVNVTCLSVSKGPKMTPLLHRVSSAGTTKHAHADGDTCNPRFMRSPAAVEVRAGEQAIDRHAAALVQLH